MQYHDDHNEDVVVDSISSTDRILNISRAIDESFNEGEHYVSSGDDHDDNANASTRASVYNANDDIFRNKRG